MPNFDEPVLAPKLPALAQATFRRLGASWHRRLANAASAVVELIADIRSDDAGVSWLRSWLFRSWCQAGDDPVELRVPPQRLPVRMQTQLAIADPARPLRDDI